MQHRADTKSEFVFLIVIIKWNLNVGIKRKGLSRQQGRFPSSSPIQCACGHQPVVDLAAANFRPGHWPDTQTLMKKHLGDEMPTFLQPRFIIIILQHYMHSETCQTLYYSVRWYSETCRTLYYNITWRSYMLQILIHNRILD